MELRNHLILDSYISEYESKYVIPNMQTSNPEGVYDFPSADYVYGCQLREAMTILKVMDYKSCCFARYLNRLKEETYIQGDDSIIGVPICLYLPDRMIAIEFYKPHGNKGIYYTEEWVKNDLCRRNHITMIRLLEKKYKDFDNCICLTYLGYSLEILDLLIKQLFSMIRIEEDIDLIRDIFNIEKSFHNMVRMY